MTKYLACSSSWNSSPLIHQVFCTFKQCNHLLYMFSIYSLPIICNIESYGYLKAMIPWRHRRTLTHFEWILHFLFYENVFLNYFLYLFSLKFCSNVACGFTFTTESCLPVFSSNWHLHSWTELSALCWLVTYDFQLPGCRKWSLLPLHSDYLRNEEGETTGGIFLLASASTNSGTLRTGGSGQCPRAVRWVSAGEEWDNLHAKLP